MMLLYQVVCKIQAKTLNLLQKPLIHTVHEISYSKMLKFQVKHNFRFLQLITD